jgi:archaemetzincin
MSSKTLKVGILPIGEIDTNILNRIREDLNTNLPKTDCTIINQSLPVPKETFDIKRQQYRSDIILANISNYARQHRTSDKILSILDVDVFVPPLNFVFGEAESPGRAALISLWRLKPEYYGKSPNSELFLQRTVKEASHEIGHTLGVKHCSNLYCVMYFSNSIFETDRKQSLFCAKCNAKIEEAIDKLGQET